jgi:hypothetical protein
VFIRCLIFPFPYFILPLPISLTTSSESPKKQPDAAGTKARKNTMRGEGEGTEVCNHKSPSNNEKENVRSIICYFSSMTKFLIEQNTVIMDQLN